MKKFLIKISLFVLPILCILLISEYLLRQVPNDYKYKNNWLENNCKDLEIIALGSSHGLYGINPRYFDKKAFNAAHTSQSLKYDYFIFDKFVNKMDSLKIVVLPISYFSLYSPGLEAGLEPWRAKYYSIYYGCKYHRFEPKYNLEIFNLRLDMLWNTLLGKENHITCTELGFGTTHHLKDRKNNWKSIAYETAKRHTKILDKDIFQHNKNYIEKIAKTCNERNIYLILLNTPIHECYRKYLCSEQLDSTLSVCYSFEQQYPNIIHLNMMNNENFTDHDFYDGDHLNEYGAKKLTIFLNQYFDTVIFSK